MRTKKQREPTKHTFINMPMYNCMPLGTVSNPFKRTHHASISGSCNLDAVAEVEALLEEICENARSARSFHHHVAMSCSKQKF